MTEIEEIDAAIDCCLLGQQIERVMEELTPRQRQVLSLRYGLDGNDRHSIAEAARALDCSATNIRLLEQRALGQFRSPWHIRVLEEYL